MVMQVVMGDWREWCPSGSVCQEHSVNLFRAPLEGVLITGTARGVCGSAWIGRDIVDDGEDVGGRQLGDAYRREDFPSVQDWLYCKLMVDLDIILNRRGVAILVERLHKTFFWKE